MEWLELNIDTSHAGLDAVTDMLEQQGVTGLIIDDEADFQNFLENTFISELHHAAAVGFF